MLNNAAIETVDSARWGPQFVRPLYDSFCFSQIPNVIRSVFSDTNTTTAKMLLGPLAGRYDKVILIVIDAFGWRFFERYWADYPFLRRIMRNGFVTKLTSQFPSTTAANLTAIHTGEPVNQSGIYEWFIREPRVDAIIAPLMFSFAGDKERATLIRAGLDASNVFPDNTLYKELMSYGVRSFVFQNREYTPSPFTEVVLSGAQVYPFASFQKGVADLAQHVTSETGPAYYFLYFDGIDAAGHHDGFTSGPFARAVHYCFEVLESVLHNALFDTQQNTLLLLTADHGQVEIDPSKTMYLNVLLPEMDNWIRRNRHGNMLVPAGSCRDLFLHLYDQYLDAAYSTLKRSLAGRAEVHFVKDLIAQQFFGQTIPSDVFMRRVGDLVVLPYRRESVWWSDSVNGSRINDHGYHGGLTAEEMHTQLLALSYG